MKRKYLFNKIAVTILLVTAVTQIKSNVGAEISNTSQFESALITKNKKMTVYDGNKLKFGDTKDAIIFEDDFSDENMGKWNEHDGVHIEKEGDEHIAVFPTNAYALLNLPVEKTPGVHRLSFDIRYENYNDVRDVLKTNIANNDFILGMGSLPIKVGEWAHVEYVIANNFTQDIPQSYLEIIAPKTNEASNTGVTASIKNIKFSNITPTINEEFTSGKIDERLSVNSDFKYEIQNNNILKVTMPSNKLSVANWDDFDKAQYRRILSAHDILKPTIYDPLQGIKQEGALFLVGLGVGENSDINSQLITAVTLSIEEQNQISHERFNNSALPIKGFMGVIPHGFPLGNSSLTDSVDVDYEIGEAKVSENLKEDGVLYIDYFKAYKGMVNENSLYPLPITKVMSVQ